LDIVQKRYPALRCKFKDGKPPEFVGDGIPEIPIHILQRKHEQHWIEEVEQEMLKPLPWRTGPLVRTTLINSENTCGLLATFCHTVSDGTSGLTFVRNLLTVAGQLAKGKKITSESPFPELPSTLDLLKKGLEFEKDSLNNQFDHKDIEPVILELDKEVPPEERITRIIQQTLDSTEVTKLIANCRKEKVSVHVALCAALLQSVAEQIREQQNLSGEDALMIGCTSPVNIRHLLDRSVDEDIGLFIANAFHFQLIDDNSTIWEASRNVKRSLDKAIKSGENIKGFYSVSELLKVVSTPLEVVKAIDKTYPPVAVTNLGQVNMPETFGDIVLKNIHFTVSINPAASSGLALAVSSFRDSMNLNFLYLEPCLLRKKVEAIINRTMKRLKGAIK
jgi:NRPS condensation-like uncharacterized protein